MTDPHAAQRAVLVVLLEAHPKMVEVDELTARLTEVPRVREAVRVLIDDGLARQLGELVGVSRAAVRAPRRSAASSPAAVSLAGGIDVRPHTRA